MNYGVPEVGIPIYSEDEILGTLSGRDGRAKILCHRCGYTTVDRGNIEKVRSSFWLHLTIEHQGPVYSIGAINLDQINQCWEVTQEIEAAAKQFPRLRDYIQPLEWRFARNPEKGVHRKDRFWIHRQAGIGSLGIPEISVLYSFTDDEVKLQAIYIRPAS